MKPLLIFTYLKRLAISDVYFANKKICCNSKLVTAAYLPKIYTVYNKRKATPVTLEARKPLINKDFRASLTLMTSLYI